jgi:ferredoxin
MPLKSYTTEDDATFSIGRALYAKRFDLTVDKAICTGCDICVAVCPREAVTLRPRPKGDDGVARAPEVRVDVKKCDYHGACAVTCPFGAITVTVNGDPTLPIVAKEAYPELVRDIQIDAARCDLDCNVCAEACPLDAITVRFEPLTDEEMATRGLEVANGEPRPQKPVVEVDAARCACCKVCEDAWDHRDRSDAVHRGLPGLPGRLPRRRVGGRRHGEGLPEGAVLHLLSSVRPRLSRTRRPQGDANRDPPHAGQVRRLEHGTREADLRRGGEEGVSRQADG